MANENSYDNRDIVQNYIYHKLLKRGYVWEFNSIAEIDSPNNGVADNSEVYARRLHADAAGDDPDSPVPSLRSRADPHARLNRVLREAGDEIERMYQRDFAAMGDRLHFTPGTAQRKFAAVAEELFSDGVNWGRIVAFFEFGGTMCVESVSRQMVPQVDLIAHWMTEYFDGPLHNWIEENGGWDAFVELYEHPRDAVPPSWPYLKTVLGMAALGAAGVTIGALFTQK
ncbi:apoptosis regulator Bcl-2a [Sardina pilchardus]|uniref:apoptosis regulator Bcl-2a n=1 Tax=Sardina pilchardus TaxID=27697 RepID=UPI002E12051E